MRLLFLIAIFCFTQNLLAQEWFVKRDLQPEWRVYAGNSYQSYDSVTHPVNTIYLKLDPKVYRGDRLEIRSVDPFSLFQQGKLVADKKEELVISVDSLLRLTKEPVWFAIHAEEPILVRTLTTKIITYVDQKLNEYTGPLPRVKQFSRNFILVAGLVLTVFFVLILRLNPKVTFYYFSIPRLLALRESDEGQSLRVTSSANILFYLFASLLIGFGLMAMALETSSSFKLVQFLQEESFVALLLRWLYTSFFVLVVLVVKAGIIGFVAMLFGIRDQAGFHFLAFLRFALMIGFLLTFFIAGSFLIRGGSDGWTAFFYGSLQWFLLGWSILIFLKLLRRVNFSGFHLFSYLCATELIPFLVTIKVLYE